MELGRGGGGCRCHSESCGFSSEGSWTKCSEVCAGATKSRIFLCLWENSHGNTGKDCTAAFVIHKHLMGGWGLFWPVVWNVGKICGWNYSPWTDSLLMWLLLGHSALLSWGKAHWWARQCSGEAGDSWGMVELPWAPSWASGSSQGPAQGTAGSRESLSLFPGVWEAVHSQGLFPVNCSSTSPECVLEEQTT